VRASRWLFILALTAFLSVSFWSEKKSERLDSPSSRNEEPGAEPQAPSPAVVAVSADPVPSPSPERITATSESQPTVPSSDVSLFPRSVLSTLGSLAQSTWDHFLAMSFDEVKKNSSVLSISTLTSGDHNNSGSRRLDAPSDGDTENTEAGSESVPKPRFVHWGEKDGCNPGQRESGESEGAARRPPQFAGFFARTYDEYHKLLKQTFIPANLKDPFGCGYYEARLADLLPENVPEESFGGFLALTSAMGEKRTESQEVWLNLGKPKGLALSVKEGK